VDAGDPVRVQSVRAFLERMATSPDERVVNALAVSLLEVLGDDRDRLERARQSMGLAPPATARSGKEGIDRPRSVLAAMPPSGNMAAPALEVCNECSAIRAKRVGT
jgi:hypothetical protein